MQAVVLTVDQRDSRTGPDLVPATLEALADSGALRPFERTAGDEIQGVVDDPQVVIAVLGLLLRRATGTSVSASERSRRPCPTRAAPVAGRPISMPVRR